MKKIIFGPEITFILSFLCFFRTQSNFAVERNDNDDDTMDVEQDTENEETEEEMEEGEQEEIQREESFEELDRNPNNFANEYLFVLRDAWNTIPEGSRKYCYIKLKEEIKKIINERTTN